VINIFLLHFKTANHPTGDFDTRGIMSLRKEEINRKILHVFTGCIVPALILYVPMYAPHFSRAPGWFTPRWYPPALALLAAALFTSVELLRFRSKAIQRFFYFLSASALRPEESKELTGATYIAYSTLVCSILFVNQPSISFMVLGAFIWGDAAAALVGQSMGRIKIGKKTIEGSIGCFLLCLTLFLFIFPRVPHLLDPWRGSMRFIVAFVASISITGFELFAVKFAKNFTINDNLIAPVITGIIMTIIYPATK
jgi:dolichol kinase